MPTPELATERLILDPLRAADIGRLCAIAGLRAIADTTISVPHPFSAEDGAAWVARYDPEQGDLGWAIRWRETPSDLIGFVGLNHLDTAHRQAEISFWVDPGHGGKGVVTEAAHAVIAHAVGPMALDRIEAYHMRRNPGSGRVLEKLGFQQEGVLRRRVLKWGVREDVLLWARLGHDG